MKKRILVELTVLFGLIAAISTGQVDIYPGGGPPFDDAGVLVKGSSDATKGIRFEVDTNVPTGTTVVITAPAANISLAGLPSGALTASRLVNTDASAKLQSNAALTTNAVPKASGTGSLADGSCTDASSVLTCAGITTTGNITNGGGHYVVSGTVPTSCASTGLGGGGSPGCALDTGSTDHAGTMTLTTGSSSTASAGAITLTFSTAYPGSNTSHCMCTLASGGSTWDPGSLCMQATASNTAPVILWKNSLVGSGTLVNVSTTYKMNYLCIGK